MHEALLLHLRAQFSTRRKYPLQIIAQFIFLSLFTLCCITEQKPQLQVNNFLTQDEGSQKQLTCSHHQIAQRCLNFVRKLPT